jgi:hypothetical protein
VVTLECALEEFDAFPELALPPFVLPLLDAEPDWAF